MRCGAFVDRSRIPQYTEQDYNLPETPPFSWLLRKTKSETENKTDDEKLSKSNDENSSPNNNNLSSRIAEASKLSQSPKDNVSGTSPSSFKSRWSVRENKEDDKLLKELVSLHNMSPQGVFLTFPPFLFKHFPFANQSPIGDLAKFYRECFNAPPLESFAVDTDPTFDHVESETVVDDLTRQLAEFETSLNEFDGLITSLCVSENQANS